MLEENKRDLSFQEDSEILLKNRNEINETNEIKFNFLIKKELIKPYKDYSLEVHIDINNDKKISNGDYINIQN